MAAPRIVLVEYLATPDSIILFGLRADWETPKVAEIKLDLPELRDFVIRFFVKQPAATGAEPASTYQQLQALDRDEWRARSAQLVAPILAWAAPGDYLYLAPHYVLNYLPLHAAYAEDGYLIERNPVIYTPSAAVLKFCQIKRKGQRRSALILADSLAEEPVVFARDQALAVAELFDRVDVYVGSDATAARVGETLAASRDAIDVLHFAVHGAFNPLDALQSGVRLADKPLTAEDFFRMDFSVDLVALSACETGINERRPGDELIGLARSLIYAGTPSVLVSLWAVDELSTSMLMRAFYEELIDRGATKAEALQRAQLRVKHATAGDVLSYAQAAHTRLGQDPHARAYLELAIADIQIAAHDFAAAQATYEQLLASPGADAAQQRRAQAGVQKARFGAGAGVAPDYQRHLYADLYYWAPFLLVGDWQ